MFFTRELCQLALLYDNIEEFPTLFMSALHYGQDMVARKMKNEKGSRSNSIRPLGTIADSCNQILSEKWTPPCPRVLSCLPRRKSSHSP
jgi:hypothetical protein